MLVIEDGVSAIAAAGDLVHAPRILRATEAKGVDRAKPPGDQRVNVVVAVGNDDDAARSDLLILVLAAI
jgi:hypothetical protein